MNSAERTHWLEPSPPLAIDGGERPRTRPPKAKPPGLEPPFAVPAGRPTNLSDLDSDACARPA
jgi:hypothetical protein